MRRSRPASPRATVIVVKRVPWPLRGHFRWSKNACYEYPHEYSILVRDHAKSGPSDRRAPVDSTEDERQELVLFLVELGAFDAQQLALELGYPSTLGCLMG